MARQGKRRFWRICRIYFRRFRISVWLVVLALLSALVYLNQVGLPGFVKRPLLEKLRARGVDLQFSRLRLRWYEGIVADNVRFGRAGDLFSPQLTLREVQVALNWRALTRAQLQVDALVLRHGRLVWPLSESNQPPRHLWIEDIQTQLRFLPDDQWALDHFKARFAGANIELSGVVTNASKVRDWKLFHAQGPAAPAIDWQERLQRLADTLESIEFSSPPDLHLEIRGDARDLQSFGVRFWLTAPGAETPWGSVARGRFAAQLFPATSNGWLHMEMTIEAAGAETRWGAITNFELGITLATIEGQSQLIQGDLNLSASRFQSGWCGGSNALLTTRWVHALTNPVPLSGQGQFECEGAQSGWGGARRLELSGYFALPEATNPPPSCDDSWGWWTNLQPYHLDWECQLTGLDLTNLQAANVTCGGTWRAPHLSVTNLAAKLYGGDLAARAGLDVATRGLEASLNSDFDVHRISPLLPESGRRWLEQFSWARPPRLKGELAFVLPAWTNRQPDWVAEVQPTLSLQGEFNLEQGGSYHGVQFSSARSQLVYSNECWHLPDLTLTRPDGGLRAEHRANDRTKEYYWRIDSTVDLGLLRPLLATNQQAAFNLFTFTQPPIIEAEIWGQFHDQDRTSVKGHVAMTNFTFRGQTFSSLQTAVQYTNRVLQFFEPRIERGTQHLSADGLTADFNAQLVYLTNGFSTAEPLVIAGAIGPHILRAIQPYRFDTPPVGHVYGAIPMRGEQGADLHFDLDGGPFHWWKFNVDHIAGHVHWAGETLELSDLRMTFYQGRATGSAAFQFRPGQGADFHFAMSTTNTLLQALMADLFSRTNQLEGRLSGNLFVTRGNTVSEDTVNGHGNLDLRDGLIWDIPLFGVFTPVLNGISPGLGNSRANAATCNFVITNGVIRTDDLEIRSPAMRLDYRGTVDLEGRVNAKVEAELLRDMWLVGPLLSTMFWPVTKLFETKVTGTLNDPKTGTVNPIGSLMLMPFHPFRTIKGLLPEDANTRTNAPPAIGP